MIVVNSGIMQKKLKEIVENCSDYQFTFVKKDGIQLFFDVNTKNQEDAVAIAKKAIKSDPIGGTLLVSVKIA